MDNKNKKGITRRESLQWGAGMLAGMVLPFSVKGRAVEPDSSGEERLEMDPVLKGSPLKETASEWVRDLVVVAMPAAAVGGQNAGVYTAAENGIEPWKQAIIRWLTSRNVRGNGGVLIRQEGADSGAGLTSVVDPNADYIFEVLIHVPGGSYFGTKQEDSMQVWAAVLDMEDRVIEKKQVDIVRGDWAKGTVSFSSGDLREVRCVVYATSVKRYPCLYYADEFRLSREDYAWWNPQNYFHSSRTTAKLKDNRQVLMDTLHPDALAGHNGVYLNWDGFFSDKGVFVGGGNWEQEYNHVSIDDPMLPSFEDNGIARDIDGKKIGTSLLWPGYQMCHSAPAYRKYFIDRVTRISPEINLFTQDNINMPSFQGWGKGCFCTWCNKEFRQWLANNRSLDLVKRTGIQDAGSFDILKYVDGVRQKIDTQKEQFVLRDPVLKAYLLFQYVSQVNLWKDAVSKIKQAANHPIAVMGNQYGNNGEKPFSVALSQAGDVVCTESNIGTDAKFALFDRIKALMLVKLGYASGEFRRPVWLQYSALFHSPVAAKSRLRFISAQSLANNGIPFTWATTVGPSGWFFDTEASICRFMQRYRQLFSRCDGYANVGLVYSLPTQMWKRCAAFELSPEKYQTWFYSFAMALEEMHISYEVNCWWHPLLGDDTVSMQRLSRYKVLILTGVECFTESQLKQLQQFKKRGGHIITVALPNLYDENVEPISSSVFNEGRQVTKVSPDILTDYKHFHNTFQNLIAKALEGHEIIRTDAPKEIWSSLQLDERGKVLSLHLVNGNINEPEDKFYPTKETTWSVRLPKGFVVDRAKLIRLENPEQTVDVSVQVTQGQVKVTVPLIEGYTIVSFYSGSAWEEAEAKSKARRADLMKTIKIASK
ncbi:hypothetical protein [Sphingobacterium chuzhouense]|uniref:Beta-galactosidase trimerisation domain-containing protein n=1 Tax=Sphingobacterium chuzhouense TaxID=1742264 RepID=A0ABR7XU18_9SPHI|nr:hypothetical protein [Sphingobacterium chuzhouense]MBD1422329.1 hypothetical protein [Sphingobacterium chuzhouense]